MTPVLELIKTLCALDGVSGSEDRVRDEIAARVKPFADDLRTDAMGNLIVFKKGKKTPSKSLMLCAHMDEVGLIVTGVTEDGYLKFATVGGIDRRVLIGKTVYIGAGRLFGVVGNKAYHLVKKGERDRIPALDEMYIDIGAANREEASKRVSLGDVVAFDNAVVEFGSGFIKAKALDDRIGCAVMIKLLESALPVDCTFAFVVQEEVGNRGAFGAAFSVKPDFALIIETATTADLPGVPANNKVTLVGKGPVIPFMDKTAIYDRELFKMLTTLADRHGIHWQVKTSVSGGTDGGAVQRSRAGVKTADIAVPVRNLHSPASVAAIADIEAQLKLLELFLLEFGELY